MKLQFLAQPACIILAIISFIGCKFSMLETDNKLEERKI
jgi:hypothetical protein